MNATLKLNTAASAAQTVQSVLGTLYTQLSARLSALAGEISHAMQVESDAQRAIADLATMNERQLRDIGLMRSDIESAVRGRGHTDCRIGR